MEARRGIVESGRQVAHITCPLLVLHSDDDESVSLEGAQALHAGCASTDKRLIILNGQGHVLTQAPDREACVHEAIRGFLERVSSREARNGSPDRPTVVG